ncbi:hypothetical protein NY547_16520 [Cnuibacter physcomitrellae]|uniref:hypothetical protein n=1 Tax=Cnuibacter physcomitrellae TaxID=1619308 RepID=UPI002175759D|nr:hypothetical protein [Cnuibacter physcomitrellae]MCS5498857.1 hypothetical protein [Cnuibacter physcomitrellae]
MSRTPFHPGTWRQALVTLSGVLPVSLVLNLVLAPLLAPFLPRLVILALNAALLVAALNWALLPGLHWATKGWALRTHPRERR